MNEPVLRIDGLSKRFERVQALEAVSLEIRAREVVGVIGENGAGKSTLLKTLAGLHRRDAGRIFLRGQEVNWRSIAHAAKAGIGMLFQEQSLLPNLSVAENILLGHEEAALRAGFYDWRTLRALAAAQLDKLGSRVRPTAQTDTLSFADRQIVELARILSFEERTECESVILLDEPTSVLDTWQTEIVLTQIERLRARASVVFVSHRLDEVLRVCDRIYVMVDGQCVAQRYRKGYVKADLQRLMLGRTVRVDAARPAPPPPAAKPATLISVRGLCRAGSYHAVSFELRIGEVLGIAGTEGSGRESLCRTLFGIEVPDGGEILLEGQSIRLRGPADAVRLGIGYVPAERSAEGIVGDFSVRENLTLVHLEAVRHGPVIDLSRESALAGEWMERLRIKPGAPETVAHHLSGGNQQKLMLAKWLVGRAPKALILERPLRGLDVGAKADIVSLIRELTRRGIAILLIADTLDELVALSDAVLVMKDGAVSGRFHASSGLSEQQILEQMV